LGFKYIELNALLSFTGTTHASTVGACK